MNANGLEHALALWQKARSPDAVTMALTTLANWAEPAGIDLRPNAAGTALNVHRKGETASLALLYLNAPRTRRRDPALVVVAAAAIEAIGKAVAK
jgi:hypothetical protein